MQSSILNSLTFIVLILTSTVNNKNLISKSNSLNFDRDFDSIVNQFRDQIHNISFDKEKFDSLKPEMIKFLKLGILDFTTLHTIDRNKFYSKVIEENGEHNTLTESDNKVAEEVYRDDIKNIGRMMKNIKDHYPNNKFNRLLEVGAGTGRLTPLLSSFVKKIDVLEQFPFGCKKLKELKVENLDKIFCSPIKEIPLAGPKYDVIFFEGVLSDLKDFEFVSVMLLMNRQVENEGKLVLRELISTDSTKVSGDYLDERRRPMRSMLLLMKLANWRPIYMELGDSHLDDDDAHTYANFIFEKDI